MGEAERWAIVLCGVRGERLSCGPYSVVCRDGESLSVGRYILC